MPLNALAISASFQPPPSWFSSAISNIWARLIRRTEPVPLLTRASNPLRSSSSSLTRYRFFCLASFPLLCSRFQERMPHLHLSGKTCLPDYSGDRCETVSIQNGLSPISGRDDRAGLFGIALDRCRTIAQSQGRYRGHGCRCRNWQHTHRGHICRLCPVDHTSSSPATDQRTLLDRSDHAGHVDCLDTWHGAQHAHEHGCGSRERSSAGDL